MNSFEKLEQQQQQQPVSSPAKPLGFGQTYYQQGFVPQYGVGYQTQMAGAASHYQNPYYAQAYYGQQAQSYWPQQAYQSSYPNQTFPSQIPTQQTISPISQQISSQSNSAHQHSQQNQNTAVNDPENTSRWGKPITISEIETFRQTYMPWFKQYVPTKQQNGSDSFEQNPAAGAAMKLGTKCPDKLSSYIERSFQKCINEEERVFMESALKKICNASKAKGNLFNRDWDSLPVPTLPREGPHYTVNNARLESTDVIINSLYNPNAMSQAKNLVSQQASLYQQFSLQPQIQTSFQSTLQRPDIFAQKQQLISNTNFAAKPSPMKPSPIASLFGKSTQETEVTEDDLQKRKARLEKFNSTLTESSNQAVISHKPIQHLNSSQLLDSNIPKHKAIIGTSTTLEKSYFRLTSAVDEKEVRPEHILKKSLKLILSKWKAKTADYKYMDDQFRSIRQDLTVQGLENDFVVKVYEAHARIALECADLDQFNQCQTKLHYFYLKGIEGHRIEFLSYKILYQVFIEIDEEIMRLQKDLSFEEKMCEPVQHALNVRKSITTGNFARFFKLYRDAPNMSGYMIDIFIDKYRVLALQKMALAQVTTNIETGFISHLLAFDNHNEAISFLTGLGCKIDQLQDKKKYLMCRESLPSLKKAPLKVKKADK